MVIRRGLPDVDVLRSEPPLLIVENLSPSTRHVDLGLKRQLYAAAGAAWYWVFDVDAAELTVFENRGGEFVEAQRIRRGEPVHTAGPFPVSVDLDMLIDD